MVHESRCDMISRLEREIADRLARYLAGDTSRDSFVDWFVIAMLDVGSSTGTTMARFAYAIDLVFAEFSGGFCAEDELQRRLSCILRERSFGLLPAWSATETSSSILEMSFETPQLSYQLVGAG